MRVFHHLYLPIQPSFLSQNCQRSQRAQCVNRAPGALTPCGRLPWCVPTPRMQAGRRPACRPYTNNPESCAPPLRLDALQTRTALATSHRTHIHRALRRHGGTALRTLRVRPSPWKRDNQPPRWRRRPHSMPAQTTPRWASLHLCRRPSPRTGADVGPEYYGRGPGPACLFPARTRTRRAGHRRQRAVLHPRRSRLRSLRGTRSVPRLGVGYSPPARSCEQPDRLVSIRGKAPLAPT